MMAPQLVFATQNEHKAAEIGRLLDQRFHVVSLKELGYTTELEETGSTLLHNALQKARFVSEHVFADCFADDTGLEVEALNGEPGVHSARYAGIQRNDADNIRLLLQRLQGKANRRAQFRTVIVLIYKGNEYVFEGRVTGQIIDTPRGTNGFGYDPVFQPDGRNESFAEMDMQEKNTISHRARAFELMKNSLLSL